MKSFTQWLESLTSMLRSFRGENLPKDITPEQRDNYNQLRNSGVSHERALQLIMGQPTIFRPTTQRDIDMNKDIEGRWK
jgi:hypothetical protein